MHTRSTTRECTARGYRLGSFGVLASLGVALPIAACSVQLPSVGPWQPLPAESISGPFGERLRTWRTNGLCRVANDPTVLAVYALGITPALFPAYRAAVATNGIRSFPLVVFTGDGFRVLQPGETPESVGPFASAMTMNRVMYHGEHVGKWLHAATLAEASAPDARRTQTMRDIVGRLLATQDANGYLGTYPPGERLYDPSNALTTLSWDVWNARYVLYGLLAYGQFHRSPQIVAACSRLGLLLANTFPADGRAVTSTGQHGGMASASVLESVVKLYERTGDEHLLQLARRIARELDENPNIRLTQTIQRGADASPIGNAKAYEMMADLLGLLELHRVEPNQTHWAPP